MRFSLSLSLEQKRVMDDPDIIKDIEEQTEDICIVAVHKRWSLLYYVKKELFSSKAYSNICMVAVSSDYRALEFVDKELIPDSIYCKICIVALKQNRDAFQFINYPFEEIYLAAIEIDPSLFILMCRQTENVCKAAVSRDGLLLKHIQKSRFTQYVYDEICHIAAKQNIKAVEFIKKSKCPS